MDFYHGSTIAGLKELKPFKRPESNMAVPCVYLTTSRHLALHYIWDLERCPMKMPMLNIRDNDVLVFQEMFPGALAYFYIGLKGYIYHCIGDYSISKQVGVATCAISKNPVPVVDCETIDDVYDEIMLYEGKGLFVYEKYETLPPYRYQLIHDIIIRQINHFNMLSDPDSDISRFTQDKFPHYWEEAALRLKAYTARS